MLDHIERQLEGLIPFIFFVCFCFLEEGRGGNMAKMQVCGKYQEANGGKLPFG